MRRHAKFTKASLLLHLHRVKREGMTFTPILRDGGVPNILGIGVPASQASLLGYGGTFKIDAGHVEWIDARSIQSGFTTTFAPNTVVPYTSSGKVYDVDFTSRREGKTNNVPTYFAITSRSFHTAGVNASFIDGSVRFVSNSSTLEVWRSLGTRAGGEVTSDS